MFQIIEFLKKRPSDNAIRAIWVVLSLAIAILLVAYRADYHLPFEASYTAFSDLAKYILAGMFILHAILFGFIGICGCKRSIMKKIQMLVGLCLIVLGNLFSAVEPQKTEVAPTESVSLSSLQSETRSPVPVGFFIALFGVFVFLAGASGKMILSKCLKYGETIVKIRV